MAEPPKPPPKPQRPPRPRTVGGHHHTYVQLAGPAKRADALLRRF